MTILVSSVSDDLIVMLSDSTITTTHFTDEQGNHFNEYETGSKYYSFSGVGCITTWGDHIYNRLGIYLRGHKISAGTHSITDLAELTYRYILDEYRKDESDELGFHIGGFDRNGKARLYHVFWGFDRPKPAEQKSPTHHSYDHSEVLFLYNGRNDLADIVIRKFLEQISAGEDTRFDLKTSVGRICLCDFVARFAAEMTPQVGPPFVIHLIFPDNSIERIENTSFSPISLQSMASVLPKLFSKEPASSFRTSTRSRDNYSLPTYDGGTVSYFTPKDEGD